MKVLITGSNGQLGKALQQVFPNNIAVDSEELDITDLEAVMKFDTEGVEAIINAAAYTKVDDAERIENRELVERVNKNGVENLTKLALSKNIIFVHISTDYVFDGSKQGKYTETDDFKPLNVYGKTKAEGDLAALNQSKHYIFRTSWVIGEGNNFVNTIKSLAGKGVRPSVVNDQFGRLTFTDTLASGINFALKNSIPFGTYNLTNSGNIVSWADIAEIVYIVCGKNKDYVTPVSTESYYRGKEGPIAKRPKNSVLDLSKINSVGFMPEDWHVKLKEYLKGDSK